MPTVVLGRCPELAVFPSIRVLSDDLRVEVGMVLGEVRQDHVMGVP